MVEAAAAWTGRINVKMPDAVTLAKIASNEVVERALGDAALHGCFAHGDLAAILDANVRRAATHAADETRPLTLGTSPWAGLGAAPSTARDQR